MHGINFRLQLDKVNEITNNFANANCLETATAAFGVMRFSLIAPFFVQFFLNIKK